MKKQLTLMAFLLSICLMPMNAQKNIVAAADSLVKRAEQIAQQAEQVAKEAEEQAEGVVAYSDTTGVSEDGDSAYVTISRGGKQYKVSVPSDWIDDDLDDSGSVSIKVDSFKGLMSTLRQLTNLGDETILTSVFGALGLSAILVFLVLFVFVILPLIILAIVLRHLIKRHNQSVDRTSEYNDREPRYSSEPFQGERLTDSMREGETHSDYADVTGDAPVETPSNYQWERGVRNTSIGVGIALLFQFMDLDGLVGLGLLIAILGIGQMVIAKTSK